MTRLDYTLRFEMLSSSETWKKSQHETQSRECSGRRQEPLLAVLFSAAACLQPQPPTVLSLQNIQEWEAQCVFKDGQQRLPRHKGKPRCSAPDGLWKQQKLMTVRDRRIRKDWYHHFLLLASFFLHFFLSLREESFSVKHPYFHPQSAGIRGMHHLPQVMTPSFCLHFSILKRLKQAELVSDAPQAKEVPEKKKCSDTQPMESESHSPSQPSIMTQFPPKILHPTARAL